ncbi:MAG: TonB-dependent receptor [Gemmatimonadetes bacterium]|nr:TonB-dependent receptor [Gemmatimonadota bacterium]
MLCTLILLPMALTGASLAAQERTDTTRVSKLVPIVVTASRQPQQVARTASPVLVVDSSVIRREAPNGIADLFRNLPGVDVTGVGPNQTRLSIRGQRGQRILLAEDGLKLNNPRRQQDFGEIPAITDVDAVSRVEIVRGPSSVLYGTDAIGGVVNQVTQRPPVFGADGFRGAVSYRYSSADGQNTVRIGGSGRSGRLGFVASAGYRDADAYAAPAGTFGRLQLAGRTKVNDTGVTDERYSAGFQYDLDETQQFTVRASRYEARNAGFGYVDGSALGDQSGAVIRLLYPDQAVTRVVAGYQAARVSSVLADRVSATVFRGWNARTFDQAIDIPFGAPLPPTAGISIRSRNLTDITSTGARVEAAKVIGQRHTVTYGIDWYLDQSRNSDSSVTTTNTGFGPPRVRTTTAPTLPNALVWNAGLFGQSDLALHDRFTLGLGIRAQTVQSTTRQTAGLPRSCGGIDAAHETVVGGVSGRFAVTDRLNLVGSLGRAFRAPNLVERYFDGVTAEGNGYQVDNPDLTPETSLNADIGFKFRSARFYAELFLFSNTISNGIRAVALGTRVNNFPAFQNQNVQKLRDRGIEALAEVDLGRGFHGIGHFTRLDSENADEGSPVGDSYSSKVGGELLWREPRGRFTAGYEIRHQGERKDIVLVDNPVGDRLPAFTVHAVRAEAAVGRLGGVSPTIGVAVTNLTNVLYAEASNTSFFRPEPRRSVVVSFRTAF